MNGSKAFADYINCLSILENDTSQLYHALSNQTEMSLAKTLSLNIALDSKKSRRNLAHSRHSEKRSDKKTKWKQNGIITSAAGAHLTQ
jgi:hypothetical protein